MARTRHIEVAGTDGSALRDFYGTLFDWPMTPRAGAAFDYFDFEAGPELSGGIRHEPEGPAEVVMYVGVDDLHATVARATEQGAEVRIPPMDHGGGRFALVVDPAGNTLGLLEGS